MLAVNCMEKPQTASVKLDASADKGVDADFGPMPKIADGTIDLSFGPIEYVMLRFRQ